MRQPLRMNGAGWIGGLAVLCAAVYGPVVLDTSQVLSHLTGDTSQFFYAMRQFAVDEIRVGRLPLWNPHLMSGTPFVGNFQSAIFYPLNAIYLVFPVVDALDIDYALHAFLLGAFTFLWARCRRISGQGAFLAGAIAMFSSPFLLRMLGGQLTMVDAMAWAPLLFLSIELVFDAARSRSSATGPCLLGALATGMQILAGHPQTVFITAVSAGLYCALRFPGATNRLRAAIPLALMAAYGVLLAAVQLLPGFDTMHESVRTGGVGTDFATTFSFPPENLLTLIAPGFFGDRVYLPYWGQWASWDATLFFGISGLVLAIYGARHASARTRRYAPFLTVLLLFLAMGRYSPVYGVFAAIPVFDLLRGVSKFLFIGTLFAGLLAGAGYDELAAVPRNATSRRTALVLFSAVPILCFGIGAIAFATLMNGGEPWRAFLFRQMSDSIFLSMWYERPDRFFAMAATQAIVSLFIAAITLLVLAAMFWRAGRDARARHAILALGIAELLVFGIAYCDTFDAKSLRAPEMERFYSDQVGLDDRVAHLGGPRTVYARNLPMSLRHSSVWGYEPVMLHRYATLIASGVGGGADLIPMLLDHVRWGTDIVEFGLNSGHFELEFDEQAGTADLPREFDLLRCKYLIAPQGLAKSPAGIYRNPDPLPRFVLVREYVVLEQARAELIALAEPDFDPLGAVVLEQTPVPAPVPFPGPTKDAITVEDQSGDHVTLRVELDAPAILLITDPYSAGWIVRPEPDSVQQQYQLLPADYALRAIPLDAGNHHFRMEYRPASFVLGVQVTIVALILYAGIVTYWFISAIGRHLTKKAA